MPLEDNINDSSTPADLNVDWPLASDPKSEGDNHFRNIKRVLQNLQNVLNLGNLRAGSVPAVFGGKVDDSGIRIEKGGIEIDTPLDVRNLFAYDPENGVSCPVPYAPLGSDSDPKFYRTQAVTDITLQAVDAEVSSAPVLFTLAGTPNMLVSSYNVRGAGALLEHVRVRVYENDINGRLLFTSSTNEELRNGGGFNINPTGETTLTLPQLWRTYSGATSVVVLDRYDHATDAFTTTGIVLKGATLGGEFTPWLKVTGYPYTIETIPTALTMPDNLIAEVGDVEDLTTRVLVTDTAITSIPVFNFVAGTKYRWELEILATFAGGNDGYAAIKAVIDGNAINLDGAGNLGHCGIKQPGVSQAFRVSGTYTPGADSTGALTVRGTALNRVPSVVRSVLRLYTVG